MAMANWIEDMMSTFDESTVDILDFTLTEPSVEIKAMFKLASMEAGKDESLLSFPSIDKEEAKVVFAIQLYMNRQHVDFDDISIEEYGGEA